MSKQTFTTGQILTAAQMTTLQANDYNQTVSAKVASYTLVASDAGTRITMSNAAATTITVNTSLFTAGDTLTITNIGAGVCTITAGTATVSTAGLLALNQYDSGTLYFTSTGVSIWNGANPGDITGVTAGTGISGGGTSGTVTVTNSMATEISAAGDIIVGTGAGTFDNLPIGTTAQVLTADTTVSPYKVKWATPAAGGSTINYTSLSAATPSGSTYTVSVSSYNFYFIYIDGVTTSSGLGEYSLRFNADSSSKYGLTGGKVVNAPASMTSSALGFNTRTQMIFMEGGNSSANDNYAAIRIEGGAGTGAKFVQTMSAPTGTNGDIYILQGAYTGASAITSISLIETNGFTFTSGTVRIYGSN